MQKDNDTGYAILFVDDEEKTRKYFDRAFSREFRIFTASGVTPAREILERNGAEIGVLVTDQRMPQEKGVVLLRHAREHYPHIVRILTTAYSDLDDAIESVNIGEVLRYITKPWDLKLLGSELRHAMRFFDLQQERNQLMQEKLSVQQRLIEVSRARDLIVMAGGFNQVRNPLRAIRSFLLYMPIKEQVLGKTMDRWQLLGEQLVWSLATSRAIIDETRNQGMAFEPIDIAQLWGEIDIGSSEEVEVEVEATFAAGLPEIRVQVPLIRKLLRFLVQAQRNSVEESERTHVELSAAPILDAGGSEEGVKLLLHNCRTRLDDISPFCSSTELLSAFFIAYHHGGSLKAWEEEGASFELSLPLDGSEADLPPPESFWLDEIFARYEKWDL